MDAESYEEYISAAVVSRARSKVESGQWAEAGAVEAARAELGRLLPSGQATAGHEFKVIRLNAQLTIGQAWFAVQSRQAVEIGYLFDIVLDESARGKGFGDSALKCVESEVIRKGATRIELHVFADNTRAQSLYLRNGFVPVGILMGKSF